MPDDTLAKPVIELNLDDIKFRDTWEKAVQDSIRFGQQIENAFKGSADKGVAKATLSMKDFMKVTESSKDKADRLLNRLKDINKLAKIKEPPLPKAFDFSEIRKEAIGGIGTGIGRGIGLGAAGTGLAFAGAGMAGSTTFDTLTGSFKMLALTIGERLQPTIIRFADWIQRLSDKIAQTPGIGPGTAAAAAGGTTLAITKSPILATAAASITGIGVLVSDLQQKTEESIERIRKDPKYLVEQIKKATVAEQEGNTELANPIRARIKEAERRNREGINAADQAGLRAGLNRPASFSALGDVRMEGQLAGFGKGPLDIANELKELNLNLKALTGVNREIIDNSKKPDQEHNAPN